MKALLLAVAVLLLPAFSCATVAPPEDFPELPLPQKTEIVNVAGVKTDDGILLEPAEFLKALRMIKELRAERDALRQMVETYNDWAKKRSE